VLLHHEGRSLEDTLNCVVGRDDHHAWVGEQEWDPNVVCIVLWPDAVSKHAKEQNQIERNKQRVQEEFQVNIGLSWSSVRLEQKQPQGVNGSCYGVVAVLRLRSRSSDCNFERLRAVQGD